MPARRPCSGLVVGPFEPKVIQVSRGKMQALRYQTYRELPAIRSRQFNSNLGQTLEFLTQVLRLLGGVYLVLRRWLQPVSKEIKWIIHQTKPARIRGRSMKCYQNYRLCQFGFLLFRQVFSILLFPRDKTFKKITIFRSTRKVYLAWLKPTADETNGRIAFRLGHRRSHDQVRRPGHRLRPGIATIGPR